MAVAAADVKALFPELVSLADATIDRWLGFARAKHNSAAFEGKSDYALSCLAAHYVELDKRRGAGATGTTSQLQSRTVGDVTTTYAVPVMDLSLADIALASTAYGQLYIDLRSTVFADRVLGC